MNQQPTNLSGLALAISEHQRDTSGHPDYSADVRAIVKSLPSSVNPSPCLFSADAPLAANGLPTRLKVLDWGVNTFPSGKVVLDDDTVRAFHENNKSGLGRVAIDWENSTVDGSPEFVKSGGTRKTAGTGQPSLIPGDGLYLNDITWNTAGEAAAMNYSSLKPAVKVDSKTNSLQGLHSVGLSRNNGVYIIPESAPEDAQLKTFSASRHVTVARLRALGGNACTGLNLAIAAHQDECAQSRDPEYAARPSGPRTFSAAENSRLVQFQHLKGLERSIAIHNSEHRGEKYFKT